MTTTDIGDTLATAQAITLPINSVVTIDPTIGDNAFLGRDVDLFSLMGNAGDRLVVDVTRLDGAFLYLRLFDSAGTQLAADGFSGDNSSPLHRHLCAAHHGYLLPRRQWVGQHRLRSDGGRQWCQWWTGRLSVGRGARGWWHHQPHGDHGDGDQWDAGPEWPGLSQYGQTITLTGINFEADERIVFTTTDHIGRVGTILVTPTSVAGDGSSLDVVVPMTAASGMVRLDGQQVGLFLQVVPTLTDVEQSGAFHGGTLTVRGSGFTEGILGVNFGGTTLTDQSVVTGPDQNFSNNTSIFFRVPNAVPTGPITVTTLGGTSDAFGLTFNGIVATATSGTPRIVWWRPPIRGTSLRSKGPASIPRRMWSF